MEIDGEIGKNVKVLTYNQCYVMAQEKAMATRSSTLARKVPSMEEPGRLQSTGSLGIGHDFNFTFMYWRRKQQPTPIFLPRESQGWESWVGCRLWGHTESDTTEATQQQQQHGQPQNCLGTSGCVVQHMLMEQQTGSKQEKEYVKAVYCRLAYLTSMQSTS